MIIDNGAKPVYGFEYEDRFFAVYMSYMCGDSGHFDIALELARYIVE